MHLCIVVGHSLKLGDEFRDPFGRFSDRSLRFHAHSHCLGLLATCEKGRYDDSDGGWPVVVGGPGLTAVPTCRDAALDLSF